MTKVMQMLSYSFGKVSIRFVQFTKEDHLFVQVEQDIIVSKW